MVVVEEVNEDRTCQAKSLSIFAESRSQLFHAMPLILPYDCLAGTVHTCQGISMPNPYHHPKVCSQILLVSSLLFLFPNFKHNQSVSQSESIPPLHHRPMDLNPSQIAPIHILQNILLARAARSIASLSQLAARDRRLRPGAFLRSAVWRWHASRAAVQVSGSFVAEFDVAAFGAAEVEHFAEERAESCDAAYDEADAVFGVYKRAKY